MRKPFLQHRTSLWLHASVGLVIALAAGVPLFLGAAGHSDPAPAASLVWPPPPDAPRIQYLQSIVQPVDAGAKQSAARRFSNWVSGASTGNEKFSKPFGVSLDDKGNLCVTDTGANIVCCFDDSAKRWRSWNQVGKIRFSAPVAVAKKGDTLFVADSGLGAVIVFGTDGKLRFQINHDLERPSGLVISGERLYVADAARHCIAVFDLHGKFISKFGQRGIGPGEFNFPTHVAADSSGHLFVTDSMNNRIQVFDSAGVFQRQIGSAGDTSGHFGRPKGVAVDTLGHVYVVDAAFENIQIFDGEGRMLLNFGASGSNAGEFWLPNGIAIGHDNRIFVADSYNRRLQVFKYVGQN